MDAPSSWEINSLLAARQQQRSSSILIHQKLARRPTDRKAKARNGHAHPAMVTKRSSQASGVLHVLVSSVGRWAVEIREVYSDSDGIASHPAVFS
ncbi:hypothetical protein AX14_014115 [Amanita brunnescens Koide BX004]|nr:hypothetical protein AX14_014115 [Amanita brunnescens Koide BX004]